MIVGVVDSHSWNIAALFSRRAFLKDAVVVQRAERHSDDRFVSARKENIENRQYAIEVLLLQIDFHVLGDEVARVERGLHCVLQISERTREIPDA